jgi:hypothetical protein
VTIATSDVNGNPWISPVAYTYDKDWNLYFVSIPSSIHCQNIKSNKKAAVAIFDSQQLWGEGVGLQIEAEVIEIGLKDTLKIIPLYAKRKYPYINPSRSIVDDVKVFVNKYITKGELYRFYKIVPKKFWMNDPNLKTDGRVEVKL